MANDLMIQRIKKLLKHSESAKELGSEAEAQAFAMKANELLIEHNISMMDIAMSEDPGSDKFANYVYGESLSYQDNQSGSRWRLDLVTTLTYYNLCNFTFNRNRKTFRVYGNMSNVDVVVWLYNFLSIGLLRLAQERHVNMDPMMKLQYSNRYSFLKDFLLGAVRGIASKLEEQRRQQAKDSKMNALMVVNKQALNEFVHKVVPNIKDNKRKDKRVNVGAAYSEGYKAGKDFNITKPLAAPKEHKKLQ